MDDVVTRVLALNHPDAADAADEIERLQSLIIKGETMSTDKYPRLNFRISKELEEKVKAEASKNDASRGWVVRQALKHYFETES